MIDVRQDHPETTGQILSETADISQCNPRQALRRRAEDSARDCIARVPEDLDSWSPEEIRKAFFELRVHQIELEMQNQELRQTQIALETERVQYVDLYDLAPVGYFVLSSKGGILNANLTATQMLGVPAGELVTQSITHYICPEHQDAFYLHSQQTLSTGASQEFELQMMQMGGEPFWAQVTATATKDADQATVYRLVMSNSTDRKRAEAALVHSERQTQDAQRLLQLVLDTIPVRLFWKDRNLVYLGCNRLFAQDTGHKDSEELIGTDDLRWGCNTQTALCHCDEAAVIHSGTAKLWVEKMFTTLDGKQHWLSMSTVPLRDADENIIGVLGAYEDVTRRKWVDEELLKIQKIESLGLLAGGIAHDFNNILMVIMGNIAFAKMMLSPTEEAYKRLTVAETASVRAKTLTQQFLTFSSGGDPVKQSFSIAKKIMDWGQSALTGTHSTCVYSLAKDLWPVDADDQQIGQVVTNILVNADQAMAGGGIIRVNCTNVELVEAQDALPSGRFVKIDIQDEGSGILEKDLHALFDPYFTTKEAGRGLGLAAAYSIMNKHGGHITVVSGDQGGATFSLFLPAADVQVTDTSAADTPMASEGQGRILVMDDDEVVLQVVQTMLNHLGYQVELAVNGEEALVKYGDAQHSGQPFDAVIMDLIVPGGMGGEEAIQQLLVINPQAKVIVSSGYCYDPVMADYKSFGFQGVMAKPYHLAGLSKQLKQLLGS